MTEETAVKSMSETFIEQVPEGQKADDQGNILDEQDAAGETEAPESSPETGEAGDTVAPTQGEETGEETKPSAEEESGKIDFSSMSEADFEKLATRMLDPKSPFHKNDAWKRILGQRDKFKSESGAIWDEFVKTNPAGAKAYLASQGRMEEANAIKAEEAKPAEPTEQDMDTDMILQHIAKQSGVDLDNMEPEERQGMKTLNKMILNYLAPFRDYIEKDRSFKQTNQEQALYREHQENNKKLAKEIKDDYGLELTTVVDGIPIKDRMDEYLVEHKNFVGSPHDLFYVSHAKLLKDFGKREQEKETAKLNDEKRRANSEQPGGSSSKPSAGGGKEKNWSEFFQGVDKER